MPSTFINSSLAVQEGFTKVLLEQDSTHGSSQPTHRPGEVPQALEVQYTPLQIARWRVGVVDIKLDTTMFSAVALEQVALMKAAVELT